MRLISIVVFLVVVSSGCTCPPAKIKSGINKADTAIESLAPRWFESCMLLSSGFKDRAALASGDEKESLEKKAAEWEIYARSATEFRKWVSNMKEWSDGGN